MRSAGRLPRHERRDISGVVLLDKPSGMTSNAALQQVKHLYLASKAGHTGSLDPLATGLLPICLGEATKFSAYLLDADKRYSVTARLGVRTETGDLDGEVIGEEDVPADALERIPALLQEHFSGQIEQVPPMYSALKKDGVPLYVYARKGETVERKARSVFIHEIRMLGGAGNEVELDVRCSKGTYIRTLVEDLGALLGCGASVAALRRTAVGPYGRNSMVGLQVLRETRELAGMEALDALLLPVETPVLHWPGVLLTRVGLHSIRRGQSVQVPEPPAAAWVRLMDSEHATPQFVGVGEVLEDGRVAPRRLLRSVALGGGPE